jgi:hypothetical protein
LPHTDKENPFGFYRDDRKRRSAMINYRCENIKNVHLAYAKEKAATV